MSFFSKSLVEIGPSGRPLRKSNKHELKKNFFAYLYLLPVLFLIAVFSYYPFIRTVVFSFSKVNVNGEWKMFNGVSNYINLFLDPDYIGTFLVTAKYVLYYLPLHIIITLSLAVLTNRKRAFSTLYQTLLAAPMAVSMSAACSMFGFLYYDRVEIVEGILNAMGLAQGGLPSWLDEPALSIPAISIITLWVSIGFDYLLLLAAIRGVPEDLLENASLAGAGGFKKFIHITIPMISPTLFFVICTQMIASILIVAPFVIMDTGGGPYNSTNTMLHYIFLMGFRQGNYTTSSSASVIAFFTTLVFVLFNFLYEKKAIYYN